MARGHTQVKRRSETLDEKKSRLGGYAKDIKLYKIDSKKNTDAKVRFRTPPYYMRKKECQKKDGMNLSTCNGVSLNETSMETEPKTNTGRN